MMRTVTALFGLAIILAIFAGLHYSQTTLREQELIDPAFVIAPGEVRSTAIQPSLPDSGITISLSIRGGPIDVYTMDAPSASQLASGGVIDLSEPFSYRAGWSFVNATGNIDFTIISDGRTSYNIIFDNSDNYYENDATPTDEVASIQITTRYLDEEERSLMLGYLATIPSILLVAVMVAKKLRRRKRENAIRHQP